MQGEREREMERWRDKERERDGEREKEKKRERDGERERKKERKKESFKAKLSHHCSILALACCALTVEATLKATLCNNFTIK